MSTTQRAFSERVIADVQWQLMGGMTLPTPSASMMAMHWEQAQRYRLQRNRMVVPASVFSLIGLGLLLAGGSPAMRIVGAVLLAGCGAGVFGLDGLVRRSEEASLVHSTIAQELPADLADVRWASIAPRRWMRWRRRRLMGKGRQTAQVAYRPVPLASRMIPMTSHAIVTGGPMATIHRLRKRRAAPPAEQQSSRTAA